MFAQSPQIYLYDTISDNVQLKCCENVAYVNIKFGAVRTKLGTGFSKINQTLLTLNSVPM